MNTEINNIADNIEESLSGEPWFGRAVYELLAEANEMTASIKTSPQSHSCIELLYHMITWAEFTLNRIEKTQIHDMDAFERLDWREIDPQIHGWAEGIVQYRSINDKIISLLRSKRDSLLEEKVDYREFNFRYLLNGYRDHNIYHAGQIVILQKTLAAA